MWWNISEYYKTRLPQQKNLFYSNLATANQNSTAIATAQVTRPYNFHICSATTLSSISATVMMEIYKISTSYHSANYMKLIFILNMIKKCQE